MCVSTMFAAHFSSFLVHVPAIRLPTTFTSCCVSVIGRVSLCIRNRRTPKNFNYRALLVGSYHTWHTIACQTTHKDTQSNSHLVCICVKCDKPTKKRCPISMAKSKTKPKNASHTLHIAKGVLKIRSILFLYGRQTILAQYSTQITGE